MKTMSNLELNKVLNVNFVDIVSGVKVNLRRKNSSLRKRWNLNCKSKRKTTLRKCTYFSIQQQINTKIVETKVIARTKRLQRAFEKGKL